MLVAMGKKVQMPTESETNENQFFSLVAPPLKNARIAIAIQKEDANSEEIV